MLSVYFTLLSHFIYVCESYPLCTFSCVLFTYVLDQPDEEFVADDRVFPSNVHVEDATGFDTE